MNAQAIPSNTQATMTRTLSVAGATAAAVAVWALAVLLGAHLVVRFGSAAPETVGVGSVVGGTVVASLIGWGLLALLERRTARARTIWTAVALVVLLGSMSLPLIAATTRSTAVVLALMHISVAAVLIAALPVAQTGRQRRAQP